jgi:hypothetical protein
VVAGVIFKTLTMDSKAIKSKINRIKSEILQLSDRNYFTAEQEEKLKPALQVKLEALEKELLNNIDVIE